MRGALALIDRFGAAAGRSDAFVVAPTAQRSNKRCIDASKGFRIEKPPMIPSSRPSKMNVARELSLPAAAPPDSPVLADRIGRFVTIVPS
jgi:hypothetical protein